MDGKEWGILGIVALVSGAFAAFQLFRVTRFGVVSFTYGDVQKDENPILFYIYVSVYVFALVALLGSFALITISVAAKVFRHA